MKIYIAHNFAAREWLKLTVDTLRSLGHEVTSTWIWEDWHQNNGLGRECAIQDLLDIDQADALLLFIDQYGDSHGRGKYVEFGYAYAKGKKCYLIGDGLGCVFYNLPRVERITKLEDLHV